jgi:hypothetical protein
MGILVFSQWFFVIIKSAQEQFCIWLRKKTTKVGVCVAPSDIKKCIFTVSLKASSYPFFAGVTCVTNESGLVSIDLFCFSHSFLSSSKNYNLAFLVDFISTSILILFIFYFNF